MIDEPYCCQLYSSFARFPIGPIIPKIDLTLNRHLISMSTKHLALFRPCIDLHNGQVKQIVGGTLSDQNPDDLKTNFVAR